MSAMLERVAKLLNQAENAGTEAEAAAFMAAAQRLATSHSIDLAHARHATVAKQRTTPVQRTIHIGDARQRGLRTLVDLYLGIARANDIECTIAHNATKVYAVGFAEDIDVSEALFASLQVQQAKALDVFKREETWRSETVYSETGGPYGYGAYKPQTWLTARLNFQEAYAYRIGGRLSEAKRDEENQARKAEEERSARLHMADDELSESFKQWFFDAHGLDLDEDDSTAQEMTHTFMQVQCIDAGGVLGVQMPDEVDPWFGELMVEYLEAIKDQDNHRDSTALVLVEKREAVAAAAAPARKRARGSYRGGTSGARSHSGQTAGRAAANRAHLGSSTAIGGVKGAIGA